MDLPNKIIPPDKAYYTVKEVAKRWNCIGVDVLRYMQSYILLPSFLFSNVECHVGKNCNFQNERVYVENIEFVSGLFTPYIFSGQFDYYKITVNIEWQDTLDNKCFLKGAYTLDDLTGNEIGNIYVPIDTPRISTSDFVITIQELRRFELAHFNKTFSPDTVDEFNMNDMPSPIAKTFNGIGKSDAPTAPAKESTRAIENLQKLLIAIVMDAYGYDPNSKDNTAVKDIQSALGKISVVISDNTIRSNLKSGAIHACLLKKG